MWQSNLTLADDSIWYRSDDPLKTRALTPPAIPDGYLDGAYDTVCTASHYDDALTLAAVAEAALCNNPQTREAYANARVQAAQVGIAKSAYLFSVNDNVSGSLNRASPEQPNRSNPFSNFNNNIVASYLLYDFGNRDANLENAHQLLQAASATQNSIVQSVLLNAIQAYYLVQAGIAALDAAHETERASEESFKAAEARYNAGLATPSDKLQAQTLFAQNTLTRITAEGTLKTAYGTLANVMGLAANQPLKLISGNSIPPQQNIDQDINTLIEQAHTRRPDLMASEAQLKAAQASIASSRAAAKPTVSLSVSNNFQDGSNLSSSNNSALGVTVSIPIFDGYGPSYRIRSAEAIAEVRSAQRDQLRLQISLDVWRAYQNLRTANESISAATVLVSSAEESSRVTLGRYKAGVGNIIDNLNAQGALATARQQKIQANLNWNIARATLAQSIGGLDNAMVQLLPESRNQQTGLETPSLGRQP
ncbi:MAG: TolC family protein [Betaproteobacteria bacterium HGW-Betaproteobacteria-20]|nr:MAG: TolC family protein [Betaproteobacteria bacterium HGW-Betaproteobacteria-20]